MKMMNNSVLTAVAVGIIAIGCSSNASAMGKDATERLASAYETVDSNEFYSLGRNAKRFKSDIALVKSFGTTVFSLEYSRCGDYSSAEIESKINSAMWSALITGNYSAESVKEDFDSSGKELGKCVSAAYASDIGKIRKVSDAAERIYDSNVKVSEEMRTLLNELALLKYRM